MAFNGSGTYSLPAGNPVTTGTTISSSWANTTLSDIATALTNCITRDGQSPPTANIPHGGYRLTGLGQATTTGDALGWGQNANVSGLVVSTLSGVLKATTGTVLAATSGTDYAPATSGSAILKGNGLGGFSSATSGTDYAPATSGSAILKGNGAGGFASAVGGTDYQTAQSVTGIVKSSGTTRSAAVAGTDYAAPTSGSSILSGNGAGGFSNVSVGTGLSFSGGTLSSTVSSVVKQVVSTNYGTTVTVSASNTWTDTGITLNITPSSTSSKVLAIVNMNGLNSINQPYQVRLLRGATVLLTESVCQLSSGNSVCSFSYLDSPATTSASTYSVQMFSASAAGQSQATNGSVASYSTITLMETT